MYRKPKQKIISIAILFFIHLNTYGQSQKKHDEIIARKSPYELTWRHIQVYAHLEEPNRAEPFTPEQLSLYKTEVLELFNDDPELVLLLLGEHDQNLLNESELSNKEEEFGEKLSKKVGSGFQKFRQKLGEKDLSYFNNKEATALRMALQNSKIVHESVESYGHSLVGGGGSYTEKVLFCHDGTFFFQSASSSSIGNGDFGGYSKENNDFKGVWDVFTQQGLVFIGLYSEDRVVLEYNPKGFIPLLVQSYTQNILRVALEGSDKIYRRSEFSCKY